MDLLKKSRDEKWRDWLIESVLLCLSILLAFWLNNWGQQRTIDARTQTMLCNVSIELQRNYTLLTDDYQPRHKALQAYVASSLNALKDDDGTAEPRPLIDRSLYMDTLDNTAWELAVETGDLSNLDFELATDIARVYKLQEESFKLIFPRIIDRLFQHQITGGNATVASQTALNAMFKELLSQEAYIIDQYESLLAKPVLQDPCG